MGPIPATPATRRTDRPTDRPTGRQADRLSWCPPQLLLGAASGWPGLPMLVFCWIASGQTRQFVSGTSPRTGKYIRSHQSRYCLHGTYAYETDRTGLRVRVQAAVRLAATAVLALAPAVGTTTPATTTTTTTTATTSTTTAPTAAAAHTPTAQLGMSHLTVFTLAF